MPRNNTNGGTKINGEHTTHGYTAKGYNAIFYRTVHYLHMAFQANNQGDNRSPKQNKDDFYANRGDSQTSAEKLNAVQLENGLKGSSEDCCAIEAMGSDRSKDFCTYGIHNAKLKFKQGELVAIAGKYRAGKTTLLQLLSGRMMCGCRQVRGH